MNASPLSRRRDSPHRVARRGELSMWVPVVVLIGLVVLMVGGSTWAPRGVTESVASPFDASPHGPLGADRLGRDVWSRLLVGGAPVGIASSIATLIASLIGVPAGVLLAGRRSKPALIGRRLIDILIVVPPLAVLLLALARVDDAMIVIGMVIGFIGAPIAGRVALAAADPVWRRGHVEQAVLRGETRRWIAQHEIVPSIAGPLIADAGLRFAAAVSVSSAATVLGYGPEPPATDWASQLVENLNGVSLNRWASLAPALAITVLAVSVNLTADAIARRLQA